MIRPLSIINMVAMYSVMVSTLLVDGYIIQCVGFTLSISGSYLEIFVNY